MINVWILQGGGGHPAVDPAFLYPEGPEIRLNMKRALFYRGQKFCSSKSVLHKKQDFRYRYPTSPGIRPGYPLSGFKNIRRPAGRISCKIEIRRIPSTSSKSQVQYKWYKLRIFQRSIQKVYFFTFVLYFRIIMSLCIFITYHMFFI